MHKLVCQPLHLSSELFCSLIFFMEYYGNCGILWKSNICWIIGKAGEFQKNIYSSINSFRSRAHCDLLVGSSVKKCAYSLWSPHWQSTSMPTKYSLYRQFEKQQGKERAPSKNIFSPARCKTDLSPSQMIT